MNDRITNEKQNVELVCQERLKENAEQVLFLQQIERNSHRFLDQTNGREMYRI